MQLCVLNNCETSQLTEFFKIFAYWTLSHNKLNCSLFTYFLLFSENHCGSGGGVCFVCLFVPKKIGLPLFVLLIGKCTYLLFVCFDSLHRHLVEHLNAEIVLHTVTDVTVALEWIRSTFLYIRALKNPTHYGLLVFCLFCFYLI